MPPASRVSTRSVKALSRLAIQSRAGPTASSPWLEMLGKLSSSLYSSMNRFAFFSTYASTALVEITGPFLHWACDRRRVPLLAPTQPGPGGRLAALVGGGLRGGAPAGQAHPPLHLRGVVSLVPRHGRDHLLEPGCDRPHQGRVRAGARRQ